MKRFHIILIALLCALTGFTRATDDKTFERFYNFTPKEFEKQLNYYINLSQIDSAMMCANVQTSKYGKEKLNLDEIVACCDAFRYMGVIYLQDYYNYQLATENYQKAEQIAKAYNLTQQQAMILTEMNILSATRNDIETNFTYNNQILNEFSKAFYFNLNNIRINSSASDDYKDYLEISLSNLLYLAIKYDKTHDIVNEISAYRDAVKRYGISFNITDILCSTVDNCNADNYNNAFETLKTPIARNTDLIDRDYVQLQAIINNTKYFILLKCGKRPEALKLLLEQEHFLRENKMTFELLEVLQLIKQHYEVDGNAAMAKEYSLLYFTTKDEFINKSRLGKMDEAKLNIELEQTREKIQEMSYHQRIQSMALWSAVVIALLALTILAVLYVHYRKTKRTNRLLYERSVALLDEGKELRMVSAPVENLEKPVPDEPLQADLDLMEKITAVMETSPEVFVDTFNINRLADLVGAHNKPVSHAINICKRCNFNVLLNEYRIKEACHRLMDTDTYGSYSIEGIGNSVGFKSRSYFAAVFKDIVGMTPSAFQKIYREQGIVPNSFSNEQES